MNEKEIRISKENRMIRKANREIDKENNELKRRIKELEEENKRLDESVRALKDELFKLMVENEELKRRKKLDCFWGEKRLASLSPPMSLLIVLFFIKPTKFVSLYFENHFIRTDLYRCCIHAPCLL